MADMKVQAVVEAILRGEGFDQAKRQLEELKQKSGSAGKGMLDGMSGPIGKIGGMIAGAFAVSRIFSFVDESVNELALFERRLNATGMALDAMGIDSKEAIPHVTAFLDALAETSGVVDDETLPAFRQFVGLTQDVESALGATKLATDLTKAGFGEFGQTSRMVVNILSGRAAPAARMLGIAMKDANGHLKSNEELMKEVIDRYGDYTEKSGHAEDGVNKLAASWDRFGDIIGKTFMPMWNEAKKALAWFVDVLGVAVKGTIDGISVSLMQGVKWMAVFKAKLRFAGKEEIDDIKRQFDDGIAEIGESWIENDKEIVESTKLTAEQIKKLKEIAGRADKEKRDKEAEEIRKQQLEIDNANLAAVRARIEAESKLLAEGTTRRFEAELKLLDAAMKAELVAFKGSEDKKLEIYKTYEAKKAALAQQYANIHMEAERKRAAEMNKLLMDSFNKFAAQIKLRADAEEDLTSIMHDAESDRISSEMEDLKQFGIWTTNLQISTWTKLAKKKLQIDKDELDREAQMEITRTGAKGAAALAIQAKYDAKKVALEGKTNKEIDQIDKWSAKNKIERTRYVAQAVQQINMAVFGNNKEIAIAAAIVDTIAAAISAFEEAGGWPWGVIPMAVTLAMGYEQVQQIRNTDVTQSAGFDLPEHDALAKAGGYRWASDAVRNMSSGLTAGWAAGLAELDPFQSAGKSDSSSAGNAPGRSSGDHLEVHGDILVVGDGSPSAFVKLHRKLKQAERIDSARYIGGTK